MAILSHLFVHLPRQETAKWTFTVFQVKLPLATCLTLTTQRQKHSFKRLAQDHMRTSSLFSTLSH